MRVGVLGGGVTGLAASYFLRRSPGVASVSLFEASPQPGGWVRTMAVVRALLFSLLLMSPVSLPPPPHGAPSSRSPPATTRTPGTSSSRGRVGSVPRGSGGRRCT